MLLAPPESTRTDALCPCTTPFRSPEASRKATGQAKKQMIRVPLREGRTLHHDIKGHFGAGRVMLRAAEVGTGIIAGGPMRAVFEALGVQDVVAKSVEIGRAHV